MEKIELEIKYLKDKIIDSERKQHEADRNSEILSVLFEKHIINENDNLL